MAKEVPTKILKDHCVADDVLRQLSSADKEKNHAVINIHLLQIPSHIVPSQNGFIWAALEIFSRQRRLTIRVDDIWLAVLALLKPLIHEAFNPQGDQGFAICTREELNDTEGMSVFLSGMLLKRFGNDAFDLLMPTFSTSVDTDFGAAALILLGKDCPAQFHRKIEKRLKPKDRGPIEVLGAKQDWEKLRERFSKLSARSQDLQGLISHLNAFLDKMLQAGYQVEYPVHRLSANEQNPGP
ncbi:hypothetical protein F52700_12121 [Fusarium sp. NRRL 52700]|nr:hypothetical protein F52700_12121 [Fusarium sp. NRRL 52700]